MASAGPETAEAGAAGVSSTTSFRTANGQPPLTEAQVAWLNAAWKRDKSGNKSLCSIAVFLEFGQIFGETDSMAELQVLYAHHPRCDNPNRVAPVVPYRDFTAAGLHVIQPFTNRKNFRKETAGHVRRALGLPESWSREWIRTLLLRAMAERGGPSAAGQAGVGHSYRQARLQRARERLQQSNVAAQPAMTGSVAGNDLAHPANSGDMQPQTTSMATASSASASTRFERMQKCASSPAAASNDVLERPDEYLEEHQPWFTGAETLVVAANGVLARVTDGGILVLAADGNIVLAADCNFTRAADGHRALAADSTLLLAADGTVFVAAYYSLVVGPDDILVSAANGGIFMLAEDGNTVLAATSNFSVAANGSLVTKTNSNVLLAADGTSFFAARGTFVPGADGGFIPAHLPASDENGPRHLSASQYMADGGEVNEDTLFEDSDRPDRSRTEYPHKAKFRVEHHGTKYAGVEDPATENSGMEHADMTSAAGSVSTIDPSSLNPDNIDPVLLGPFSTVNPSFLDPNNIDPTLL